MKRLSSSSSFRGLDGKDSSLIPISSPVDGKRKYEDRFQSALHLDGMEEVEEEEDELCSIGQSCLGEKKRRLSVEQVKALEKSFEVENKLDPERKVRLAQEIGLQPRQVSVWFQNRRARWKTKQLEHDYGALKTRHDALKVERDALYRDKEVLLAKISELKSKLENSQTSAVKSEIKAVEEGRPTAASLAHKDGASDSDSSAVFNDEAGASVNYSSVQTLDERHHLVGFRYHSSPLLFQDRAQEELSYMEEGFLSGEELCSNLLSEEEAPSLSWYCSGGWE